MPVTAEDFDESIENVKNFPHRIKGDFFLCELVKVMANIGKVMCEIRDTGSQRLDMYIQAMKEAREMRAKAEQILEKINDKEN